MFRTSFLARAAIGLLAAAAIGSGCAQSTRFTTEPDDADISVNGVPIGKTPTTYQSRSGLPKVYHVTVEKPGYKPLKNVVVESSYRADESLFWLLPGIIPYFFSARLESDYRYVLRPEDPASAP
ncbi:MAG TPA: PEGA domain-containing protein [Planctomycetota bacterium]|jgi:hypothetical protein|nr:PEGA domain-containing protein [Planctomycetota bacterium]OQC22230.1 MAG: PEGA domain protein [Planctomycetes bacterium ADurb.Bin069]HNS00589.1 PEGA domain-containing protein [Planctomycetota bacterium]HNU25935.1 PEGA domain-containing protein [Planctomycetota bacterium]HOE29319.1 PEGA domain-containing protein [Planctomycetota bacterium]